MKYVNGLNETSRASGEGRTRNRKWETYVLISIESGKNTVEPYIIGVDVYLAISRI